MSVGLEITNLAEFEASLDRFEQMISVPRITMRAIKIASEAGIILKTASVQALTEAVYDNASPQVWLEEGGWAHGGNKSRTEDLLHSIVLKDEGLFQTVEVDPDMPVSQDDHDGRQMVIDYAVAVHEGYMQYTPVRGGGSKSTGIFHPGRFWFDVAEIEAFPVIEAFVLIAFEEIFMEALNVL